MQYRWPKTRAFFIFCKTFTCTCTSHNNYVRRKWPMHVIRKGIKSYIWVKKEKQYQLRNKRRSNTDRGGFFGQGYGTLLGKNLGTAVKYTHIYVDVWWRRTDTHVLFMELASMRVSYILASLQVLQGKRAIDNRESDLNLNQLKLVGLFFYFWNLTVIGICNKI